MTRYDPKHYRRDRHAIQIRVTDDQLAILKEAFEKSVEGPLTLSGWVRWAALKEARETVGC